MTTIILGSNRFTNCRTLVGIKDQPILQVSILPLSLSLKTPPGVPSTSSVEIVDNESKRVPSDLRIVHDDKSTGVFLGEQALILATLLDESTAHLKLDLRPIGLRIFDDIDGLHIGKNVLTGNAFTDCATAIALE
jgi:hypothetical protein